MVEVLNGTEPVAYVWFTFVPTEGDLRVGELHACAHPRWRGRWLTRAVWRRLHAEAAQRYDRVMAIHGDPGIARILKRVGFTQASPHVHTLTLE